MECTDSVLDLERKENRTKIGGQPARFAQLPTEIIQEVTSYLDAASVFALRQTCAQFADCISLDQKFWYSQLMRGDLLGFFFVFEVTDAIKEVYRKTLKFPELPPMWDWKKLVRKLAKYSSFQDGGDLCDAPIGFRNRRRIWRILELIECYEERADVSSHCSG